MHEGTGGIDLLVPDEPAAIAAAKAYLAFQRDEPSGSAVAAAPRASPRWWPRTGPYDMAPVIEALVDDGSFFELRPAFARSVITGFARLDGPQRRRARQPAGRRPAAPSTSCGAVKVGAVRRAVRRLRPAARRADRQRRLRDHAGPTATAAIVTGAGRQPLAHPADRRPPAPDRAAVRRPPAPRPGHGAVRAGRLAQRPQRAGHVAWRGRPSSSAITTGFAAVRNRQRPRRRDRPGRDPRADHPPARPPAPARPAGRRKKHPVDTW